MHPALPYPTPAIAPAALDTRHAPTSSLAPKSWRRWWGALFASILAPLGAQDPAEAESRFTAEEIRLGYSTRSLLAKPREGLAAESLAASEAREGIRLHRRPGGRGELRVLEFDPGTPVPERIERLKASGRYEYVEPNYLVRARATPNDPRFLANEQWGLRNIGLENGTAGADIRAESGWDVRTNASEIVVALIDSGLRRTHEEFLVNLWTNPAESGAAATNLRDDDGNGYVDDVNGIDATVSRTSPAAGRVTDPGGHGTAVASVLGAAGNNGRGMAGVAWRVQIMPLRFIDAAGFGLISDEIECVDYAVAMRAHIINASFGGTVFSQAAFDAYKRARDAGIIVVCAVANEPENHDVTPSFPSNYLLENIVAVTNTTRNDTLNASAAFGSGFVELGAPGTAIMLASASGDSAYRISSGTSFAVPMVSGALALLKAQFPTDTYRETINRLLRSVDAKSGLSGKVATGGRLNLAAALRSTSNRPFNDDFAQRAVFAGESGVVRAAAHGTTRETGEPTHAGAAGAGSLWWTWTAPRSGSLTISTVDSTTDTLLAVYTGTALNALTPVASNDDESGSLKTSKVTFTVSAGTTYQIAIDAKAASSGLVAARFTLQASNNDFASAQVVSGRSWSVKSNNGTATREDGEPRIRNNNGGRSVWFRWVAPATRRYHIASFSDDFNTMLGIYTGTALNALAEVSAVTTAGDSNSTIADAGTTLSATAGTTYHIVVDSEVSPSGASSSGDFRISCIDAEWEFFGVGAFFTPALAADGTVRVADLYGYLYGLNADGSQRWRHELSGYGTYSSPTVAANGTAYIGDASGYVYAIDGNGNRLWRISTGVNVEASPAVGADGTVYIRVEDGRLLALNPDSGAIKWTLRLGDTGTNTYSSPVVAPDGTIYCAGSDRRLYAVAQNGTQKWSYSADFIYSSPAVGTDGTVYFGVVAPTRRFYALRPDGTLKWEFIAGDTVSSSPVIGTDGSVYFGCADRKLYALTPAGELRWTFEAGDAIRNCAPLLASDGSIYIGATDGTVSIVSPEGRLRRTLATASAILGSPLLHNGRLFLPSEDGRIYAVETGHVPASSVWPMHRQNPARSARRVDAVLAIGVQPRPVSAEVGEAVTFAVGAVGAAPVAYQWFFNGQAITGATEPTYTISSVNHSHGGQYSARVTDATGNRTSNNATLTLTTPLVAPSIATAPASQTATAGGSLTLSFSALGTVPMTYQWLRNGEPIPGETGAVLALSNVRPAQSGNYTVRVTNFAGAITSAAAVVTINPVSRIANLSIRSQIGGNSGALTVGLTIGGSGTTGNKPVLLRAAGPTLAAFGVDGTLTDPRLALLSGPDVIAQNDDWAGNATVASTSTAVGAFGFADAASKDAALAHSAASGSYTLRINGAGDSSGVALTEVYDASPNDTFVLDTPRLVNVSALTLAGSGGDSLITGFAIAGATPKTVLIRGIGPTLAAFGVDGALADPKLELFQAGAATATATNDNWGAATSAAAVAAAAASVGAFALAADSRDAVLLVTLPPGSYTAQVGGSAGQTGLALIEVYEVP